MRIDIRSPFDRSDRDRGEWVRPPVVRSTEKSGAGDRPGGDLRQLPVDLAARTDVPAEPRGVKGIRLRAKVDSPERHTFATRSGSVLPVEVARRVEEAARRTRVRVPVIGDPTALADRRSSRRRRSGPRRSVPGGASSRASRSGSGRPWMRHTTIGVRHTMQSATQQSSSSWCQSVTCSAVHSRHASSAELDPVTDHHPVFLRRTPGSPRARPRTARASRRWDTGSVVHGSMSRMPTIRPASSQNAIESGINVSFIQKLAVGRAIEEEHHPLVACRATCDPSGRARAPPACLPTPPLTRTGPSLPCSTTELMGVPTVGSSFVHDATDSTATTTIRAMRIGTSWHVIRGWDGRIVIISRPPG